MSEPLHILAYQNEPSKALYDFLERNEHIMVNELDPNKLDLSLRAPISKYDACILGDCPELYPEDKYGLLRQAILANDSLPYIYITNSATQFEVLEAFEIGVDDYIQRPFSIRELACRIRAIAKRSKTVRREIQSEYKIGDFYTLNVRENTLRFDNPEKPEKCRTIHVSNRAALLLQILCSYKREPVEKHDILMGVWGEDNIFVSNSLRALITNTRKYFEDDERIKIKFIPSKGYTLTW